MQFWTKPRSCTVTCLPTPKTTQQRRTRHSRKCWRCKDGLISDVLIWNLDMNTPVLADQLRRTLPLYRHWMQSRGPASDKWHGYMERYMASSYLYLLMIITYEHFGGCRIHQLHLCRRARPSPNECPRYDTKQSDGEVPVMLGLRGIWSTPSLPLLQGPLWPGMLEPDRH